MATYYIAAAGLVTNSGTSSSSPWPLSKVGSVTYAAGDKILFNRGDTLTGPPPLPVQDRPAIQ